MIDAQAHLLGRGLALLSQPLTKMIIGGSEPGKKADFVVLSKDILTIPPDEILEARVLATYMGGERIYDTGEEWNASH